MTDTKDIKFKWYEYIYLSPLLLLSILLAICKDPEMRLHLIGILLIVFIGLPVVCCVLLISIPTMLYINDDGFNRYVNRNVSEQIENYEGWILEGKCGRFSKADQQDSLTGSVYLGDHLENCLSTYRLKRLEKSYEPYIKSGTHILSEADVGSMFRILPFGSNSHFYWWMNDKFIEAEFLGFEVGYFEGRKVGLRAILNPGLHELESHPQTLLIIEHDVEPRHLKLFRTDAVSEEFDTNLDADCDKDDKCFASRVDEFRVHADTCYCSECDAGLFVWQITETRTPGYNQVDKLRLGVRETNPFPTWGDEIRFGGQDFTSSVSVRSAINIDSDLMPELYVNVKWDSNKNTPNSRHMILDWNGSEFVNIAELF